jgi:hypothetical protein
MLELCLEVFLEEEAWEVVAAVIIWVAVITVVIITQDITQDTIIQDTECIMEHTICMDIVDIMAGIILVLLMPLLLRLLHLHLLPLLHHLLLNKLLQVMTSTGAVSVGTGANAVQSQNLAAVDMNIFDNLVEGGILQCVRPRTFQQMRDLLDGSVTWVGENTTIPTPPSDVRLKRDIRFVSMIPGATYKLYRFYTITRASGDVLVNHDPT